MTLNLVHAFRRENPDTHITYRCHPSVSKHLAPIILEAGIDQIASSDEPYECDHTYNLVGYPLAEGYPNKPMKDHLVRYFAKDLGIKDLSDKYLFNRFTLPAVNPKFGFAGPYCTVHIQAGWSPYKNWPVERWERVCQEVRTLGYRVVQIGGPDDVRLVNADASLLGKPFKENLSAIGASEFHMGIDSWSNHATNIHWFGKGKTPAVILWGSTQASAAGYAHNQNISMGLACQPCFREDPKLSQMSRGVCPNPAGQVFENPKHQCMQDISVDLVKERIRGIIRLREGDRNEYPREGCSDGRKNLPDVSGQVQGHY